MAGKIQNGAVSQPKTFGATLERPKIISDSTRPTEPKTRMFLAMLIVPTPLHIMPQPGAWELS